MFIIENLKFTKFFDVKSPIGLEQRDENIRNYSIGMDLYFPKNTIDFRNAIIAANKKLYPNLKLNEKNHGTSKIYDYIYDDKLIFEIIDNKFKIYQSIQIPTGIGLLLPINVWAEARTKSSNFQLGFTEVHGTIDMNYTFGMGVQIIPVNNSFLTFEEDQKFTQIVLHEAVPIIETQEINLKDWEQLIEVQNKRNIRVGGFGSTGTKDK